MDNSQLVSCIRAVAAYGKEIEALRETLTELLANELARSTLKCRAAGPAREADRQDDSGWVFTDSGDALPLQGRRAGPGKKEMYLGFQISLFGNGIEFPGNDEPLLHVCFWDCEFDFEDPLQYVHFPWASDDSRTVEAGRLVTWPGTGDAWKSRQWTFSLRLLTLDSSQALLERVVRPAIALIGGASAADALPDGLPGLLFHAESTKERV